VSNFTGGKEEHPNTAEISNEQLLSELHCKRKRQRNLAASFAF
jgi:hypothetical protein